MPFDESALFLECSPLLLVFFGVFCEDFPFGFPTELSRPIRPHIGSRSFVNTNLLSLGTLADLSRSIRPHIGSESFANINLVFLGTFADLSRSIRPHIGSGSFANINLVFSKPSIYGGEFGLSLVFDARIWSGGISTPFRVTVFPPPEMV